MAGEYIPKFLKKWVHPDSYMGAEYPEYYEVAGRSRDSEALERSNFNSILAALGGENEEAGVIIAKASHWAVGWVEELLIHETASEKLKIADELVGGLEDYPIVDETDFSNEEREEREQYFANGGKQDMERVIAKELGQPVLEFLQQHVNLENVLFMVMENCSSYHGETFAPTDIEEMKKHLDGIDDKELKIFEAALNGKTVEELLELKLNFDADPNQTSFEDVAPAEFKTASELEPNDIIKLVGTTGYTDPAAMLRAQYLLGMAKDKMFDGAVKEIKSKLEKEMKDRVARASKWGACQLAEKNVKDIIAKVLIENDIYPYPQLLAAIYKNPFQKGTEAEPSRESMQKPVSVMADELDVPNDNPPVANDWTSNPEYLAIISEIRDAVAELESTDTMPSSLTTEGILMEIGQRDERLAKIIGHVPTEDERIAIVDNVEEDYREYMEKMWTKVASEE